MADDIGARVRAAGNLADVIAELLGEGFGFSCLEDNDKAMEWALRAYRAGQAAAPDGPRLRLNGPMVARLRRCAADTSPNWDGAVTIYPPEARDLVALIDHLLTDATPAGGQDGHGHGNA